MQFLCVYSNNARGYLRLQQVFVFSNWPSLADLFTLQALSVFFVGLFFLTLAGDTFRDNGLILCGKYLLYKNILGISSVLAQTSVMTLVRGQSHSEKYNFRHNCRNSHYNQTSCQWHGTLASTFKLTPSLPQYLRYNTIRNVVRLLFYGN